LWHDAYTLAVRALILWHTAFVVVYLFFFFFNDTATTEIYTLSLHDALPIWCDCARAGNRGPSPEQSAVPGAEERGARWRAGEISAAVHDDHALRPGLDTW